MNDFHYSWSVGPNGLIGFWPFSLELTIVGISLIILGFLFKGLALWHAARRDEKVWFIILLVLNTFAILELIYLYFIVGLWHRFEKHSPPTTSNTPDGGHKS
jgi:hypothetical protein